MCNRTQNDANWGLIALFLTNQIAGNTIDFKVNVIKQEIDQLNSSKSFGPFSMPVKLLKILKEYLAKPLKILFNCSFATGVVPKSVKLARVIPIFKRVLKSVSAIIGLFHCYQFLIKSWKS